MNPTDPTPAERALQNATAELHAVQKKVNEALRAVDAERAAAKQRAKDAELAVTRTRDELYARLVASVAAADAARTTEAHQVTADIVGELKTFVSTLEPLRTKSTMTPRAFEVNPRAYVSFSRALLEGIGLRLDVQRPEALSYAYVESVEAALNAALARPSARSLEAAAFALKCWLYGRHEIVSVSRGVISSAKRDTRSRARVGSNSWEGVNPRAVDLDHLDAFVADCVKRGVFDLTYGELIKARYAEAG